MSDDFDYMRWKTREWDDWLTFRDNVNVKYLALLFQYANLPASDRLIRQALRRKMDPKVLETILPNIPSSNDIRHSWKQDEAGERELWEGSGEPWWGEPVPDNEQLYEALGICGNALRDCNRLVDHWIAFMADSVPNEQSAQAIGILSLLTKILSMLEVCRDSLIIWIQPKAEAVMLHAKRAQQRIWNQFRDFVSPGTPSPAFLREWQKFSKELALLQRRIRALPQNPNPRRFD